MLYRAASVLILHGTRHSKSIQTFGGTELHDKGVSLPNSFCSQPNGASGF